MIRTLLRETKGVRLASLLSALFVVGETVLEVFIPFLMSNMVDIGVANRDLGYITANGLKMVAFAMAALACGVASGRCAALASTGFARNVRRRLFHSLQDFSFANIDRFSTASLITRLTVDVTNTQMAYMMIIRIFVRAPVMLVTATLMAWRINNELALVFLYAVPVLALTLGLIMKSAHGRFGVMLKKYDLMNGAVQEKLTGIRLIKAFVREDHEKDSFRQTAEQLRQYQIRAEKLVIINMPVMMFTVYACIIAILWLGGNQIIAGTMLSGELFSFITYVTQILMSLMMIAMVLITIVISTASITRICECLNEQLDVTDRELPPGAAWPQVADGSIDFEQVDFSYSKDPQRLSLSQIDLHIDSGLTVGVIGGTGSSKTTLVQLIPRLYDATAGTVRVGGRDVRDYRIADLRQAVAMVLQNNLLFSGTIADNLRWGNEQATQQQLEAACRAAQAHDFIMECPNGYQTELGQAGVNLSGGQKQRLTIARALLKQPKIIILDDSTSAVDTATDAQLRAAFRRELADVTTIIIAQRISSVMDSDLIVVLDDGRVAAQGTHEQLMLSSPIYREVYRSQQKGAEE